MKKGLKIAMAIIVVCVSWQMSFLAYRSYQTKAIRTDAIEQVRRAVKNGALSHDEGENYVRFMQHSCNYVSISLCQAHADHIRKEVDNAYCRQEY